MDDRQMDDRQMDDGTHARVDKFTQIEQEIPTVKDKCTSYARVDKCTQMEKETPIVIDKCTNIVDPLSKNDKQHISNADISVQVADLRHEILSLKQQVTKRRRLTIKKRRPLKRIMKTKKYKRMIRRCVKRNALDNFSFISNRCPYNFLYQKYLISRKIKERNERRTLLRITDGHFPSLYQKTKLFDILGIKGIPPQIHISKMEFWPLEGNVNLPRSLDQYFRNSSQNEAQSSEQYSRSMNLEMLRLETFRHFPLASRARPIRLARAGFFYTGNGNRVECYSCGIIYRNWLENEDPREVHRRISPMCQHVQNQDQSNVPIHVQNATLLTNAGQTTMPSSEHASGTSTIQTQTTSSVVMSNTDTNVMSMSFSNMQTQGPQSFSQFGITENSSNDRPILHPNASATTGTFLSHVSTSIPNHVQNEALNDHQNNERTESQSHLNELHRPSSNNGNGQMSRHGTMIQMFTPHGITFAKPRYPSYADITMRISSFQDWPSNMTQTPRELAKAGFFYAGYGDNVRCFLCGGGLRDWEVGDDPWVEHARWYPGCAFLSQINRDELVTSVQEQLVGELSHTNGMNGKKSNMRSNVEEEENIMESAAVLSNREMGYTNDQISNALKKAKSLNKAQSQLSAVEILDILMEEETNNNDDTDVSGQWMYNSLSSDIRCLKEKNQQYMEQMLCKICLVKEVHIAMLPCGHICCCVDCAPAMRKCPICRKFIKSTVKVWFS